MMQLYAPVTYVDYAVDNLYDDNSKAIKSHQVTTTIVMRDLNAKLEIKMETNETK